MLRPACALPPPAAAAAATGARRGDAAGRRGRVRAASQRGRRLVGRAVRGLHGGHRQGGQV
eukprot:917351-Prymnesium_polylepis.1